MNKFAVAILALSPILAQAQTSLSGPIVGVEVGLFNKIDLPSNSEHNSTVPFNLYAGYDFELHDVASLGLNLEYRSLGKADFETSASVTSTVEGDGVSLNLRPKFHVQEVPIYVGLLLGLGQYDTEISGAAYKDSSTDIGWQWGAEIGYKFEGGVALSVGYRALTVDFDDHLGSTIKFSGFNLGVNYLF